MNAEAVLGQVRRWLVALVGLTCLATIPELLLQEHFKEPMQLVPLALCSLGALAALAVWRRPGRRTWLALRVVLALFVVAAGVGVLLHLRSNLELQRELKAHAPLLSLLPKTLTGASPLLAPGILVMVAAVGFLAAYRNPDVRAE